MGARHIVIEENETSPHIIGELFSQSFFQPQNMSPAFQAGFFFVSQTINYLEFGTTCLGFFFFFFYISESFLGPIWAAFTWPRAHFLMIKSDSHVGKYYIMEYIHLRYKSLFAGCCWFLWERYAGSSEWMFKWSLWPITGHLGNMDEMSSSHWLVMVLLLPRSALVFL